MPDDPKKKLAAKKKAEPERRSWWERRTEVLSPEVRVDSSGVVDSPLGDSLWAVSGGGKPSIGPRVPGASGAYWPFLNKVWIDQNQSPEKKRETAIHEAGHRYDRYVREPKNPGSSAPYHARRHVLAEREKVAEQHRNLPWTVAGDQREEPPELERQIDALTRVDDYYHTAGNEAYAQAWKNAYKFLVDHAQTDPDGTEWMEAIAKAEANTPGMGEVTKELIQQELFADHPLRARFTPPRETNLLRRMLGAIR